jgi:hypothetical protein
MSSDFAEALTPPYAAETAEKLIGKPHYTSYSPHHCPDTTVVRGLIERPTGCLARCF